MIAYESQRGRNPGNWWPSFDGAKHSATFYCPKCTSPLGLGGHVIAQDGSVNPSVVCDQVPSGQNVECPKCGFHDMVKLIGWNSAIAAGNGEGV